VTPAGGFSQQISFACTGLPTGAACSFSPSNVTPSGSAATTSLTIATAAQSSSLGWPRGLDPHLRSRATASLPMLAGGVFWLFRRRRMAGHWAHLLQIGFLLVLTAAATMAGCGGGSFSSSGSGGTPSPSQTYSVTTSATAGSETKTEAYSLTVQ
jgi:hypothetical protein